MSHYRSVSFSFRKFSGSNRSNDIAHACFIQSEQFLKVHTHGYRIECRFESRDNDTVR